MPDTTPEPEQPFDPYAAKRVAGFVDLWPVPGRNVIKRIRADRTYELRAGDLHELLRQLAWHKQTGEALAAKCASWRGQYEDARARLDAVRSVANEWHTYAATEGPADLDLAPIAGHVLKQILRALDGDPEGV